MSRQTSASALYLAEDGDKSFVYFMDGEVVVSAGTTIPVKLHITGTIDKPSVGTDLKEGAKNTTQTVIEDLKEQEVQEVIEEAKDDAVL